MARSKLQKAIAGVLVSSLVATAFPSVNLGAILAKEVDTVLSNETEVEENDENVYKVTMDENGNITADSEYAADEDTPFSWDNVNMYFVMTDRFVNGDKTNDHSYGRSVGEVGADSYQNRVGTFHGGDLAGMTQKLEDGYFDELGTNAIWITAPYEQIHGALCGSGFKHYAYHGYYVLDYTEVDANMGTAAELEKFIDTAHEHGIRVVFDIVMNHAGYADAATVNEYFGEGTSALASDWKDIYYKTNESEYKWYYDYSEVGSQNGKAGMMVAASGDWASKWWGSQWIRAIPARFSGYEGEEAPGIETCLDGLPDFKTETSSDPGIPAILKTKWTKEGVYPEKEAMTKAAIGKSGTSASVTGYLAGWLSEWVREYGVDGFRCDTAKHIQVGEWNKLKVACSGALKEWRQNNPNKPGAKWTDDFWMTGECWGHGVSKDSYYTTGGFDSMINFSYQKAGIKSGEGLDGLFSEYANSVNNDPSFNVLSYISSHDTSLGERSANAGTQLLLTPGGVQTYYGDESGRQPGSGPSDQPTRSEMNWGSMNQAILSNWQKVGRFRRNHIAVGAGKHTKIESSPYTFSRTYSGTVQGQAYEDKVVVALPGSAGTYDISVGDVFDDGTALTDEYSGEVYTVSGGKVSVTCDDNGVILLGEGGVAKASIGATASQSFTSDSLTIKLSASKVKDAYYILDNGDKVSFETGDTIEIGAGDPTGTTYTLVVGGTGEDGEEIKQKTYTYSKEEEPEFTFYIRTAKKDFDFTPYIYIYDATHQGESAYSGGWPGKQMTVDGDYYVFSSTEISKANVILNDGKSGWQDPKKDTDMVVSGITEYVKDSSKVSTITLSKPAVATKAPVTTKPTNKPTSNPTDNNTTATKTPGQNNVVVTQTPVSTQNPTSDLKTAEPGNNSNTGIATTRKPQNTNIPGGANINNSMTNTNQVTATPTMPSGNQVTATPTTNGKAGGLEISKLTVGLTSPQQVGTSIPLSMEAKGGSGKYEYKYIVMNRITGIPVFSRSYSEEAVASWVATKAGNYEIHAYARDKESNLTKEAVQDYQIVAGLTVKTFKISKLSRNRIKVKMNATGTGTVKYKLVLQNAKGAKLTLCNYSTKKIRTYNIKKKGSYQLYLYVKDSNGMIKFVKRSVAIK